MYTVTNYKTKAELKMAFARGEAIKVYQPGGIFAGQTEGAAFIEGPHYPQPHRWYAAVELKNGVIVKIKS